MGLLDLVWGFIISYNLYYVKYWFWRQGFLKGFVGSFADFV